jgi:hypothetical protein
LFWTPAVAFGKTASSVGKYFHHPPSKAAPELPWFPFAEQVSRSRRRAAERFHSIRLFPATRRTGIYKTQMLKLGIKELNLQAIKSLKKVLL